MFHSLRNWYRTNEYTIIAVVAFAVLFGMLAFIVAYNVLDLIDPYAFHERPA